MNKFFLSALIMCTTLQAYAFEDYIITSDKPVKSVHSSNSSVVSVTPFFTIDNAKNIILAKALNSGRAVIIIKTEDGEQAVNVKVSKDKTVLSQEDGLSYFKLDIPDDSPREEK